MRRACRSQTGAVGVRGTRPFVVTAYTDSRGRGGGTGRFWVQFTQRVIPKSVRCQDVRRWLDPMKMSWARGAGKRGTSSTGYTGEMLRSSVQPLTLAAPSREILLG